MALVTIQMVASDNSANTSAPALNPDFISSVTAATAGQIANFPTALTQIIYRTDQQTNAFRDRTLLSSTATATVIAAVNAAQANLLGSGISGDATLVAGTVAVTISGLTTASKVVLTRHTAGGAVTLTVEYFYVVTANTLTITAAVAAGTINTADTSVITYAVVG